MLISKNKLPIMGLLLFLLLSNGCVGSTNLNSEQTTSNSSENSTSISDATTSISEEDSSISSVSSEKAPVLARGEYANPVFREDFPDPTIVYDEKTNYYYAYATHGQIIRSNNLTEWARSGYAFSTKPQWGTQNADVWAPHVIYIQNQYVMYYSLSTWGDPNPGIGVAIAPRPNGPWVDQGALFRSLAIGVNNSIDPVVFISETEKVYMIWGSMRGNYIVELSEDGLSLKDESVAQANQTKKRIAGLDTSNEWHIDTYEAAYIHYRNGYYYLFLSTGSCCEGANSTYRVVVSRSQNPDGPYYDKVGRDMLNAGRGTLILESSELFAGPGHNSIFLDQSSATWFLYHGYRKSNPGKGRQLLMDQLLWADDGWPYIANGLPSSLVMTGPYYLDKGN